MENSVFTNELIEKTIRYFNEEYNHSINDDLAVQYLNSFADLYMSLADLLKDERLLNKDTNSAMILE